MAVILALTSLKVSITLSVVLKLIKKLPIPTNIFASKKYVIGRKI